MTLEEVYQYYGTACKAAKAVGVARQSFYVWMQRGYIPSCQQKKYQKLSKGVLIAEESPEKNILKQKNFLSIPNFRYYSKAQGMCTVKSLVFREGRPTRIVYCLPRNPLVTLSSFNVDNLMQASILFDSSNRRLYESDIVVCNGIEFVFESFDSSYNELHVNKFIIIGNIFEGKTNG